MKPVPLPGDWKSYASPEAAAQDPVSALISKLEGPRGDGVSPVAPPDPVAARRTFPRTASETPKPEKNFIERLFGG